MCLEFQIQHWVNLPDGVYIPNVSHRYFFSLQNFFSPVFVCFLKRSHILTRGQTEGLSKWRESTNAKMIRKSSLQRLDVAASLCRSVPSQCTGGALQSCSLCWLRQCSEAEEPGAPTRSLPCSCAQTVPSQTVTPAHCVLWVPVGLPCCWCRRLADLSHNGLI